MSTAPIGCGRCQPCSREQDTYRQNVPSVGYLATGLARDGGMAEYLTARARNLVPIGDADPVSAAPWRTPASPRTTPSSGCCRTCLRRSPPRCASGWAD
ncbi:alcohol dehydrogenase catalytic domain-containing protein [Dietzia sp. IN118]|uniref:alcohol dehydrogenase catalytic domain-containing protein n=1 Tax=Dietzia sp. IN118 TaxID=3061631 RepID=UPI00397792C8